MDAKLQSQVLIESLPYLRKFHGETVVIKYGGHAMKDEALKAAFARNIALLKLVGIHPVVVHGGGPQIGNMLEKLEIRSEFREGLRVTDDATMNVVEMVLVGSVNTEIVNPINRAGAVAGALRARRLIMLTDVAGVLDPEGKLIQSIRVEDAAGLYENGTVTGGMIPKLNCCIDAIEQGVEKVMIVDGRVENCVLLELLTDQGVGTEIVGEER